MVLIYWLQNMFGSFSSSLMFSNNNRNWSAYTNADKNTMFVYCQSSFTQVKQMKLSFSTFSLTFSLLLIDPLLDASGRENNWSPAVCAPDNWTPFWLNIDARGSGINAKQSWYKWNRSRIHAWKVSLLSWHRSWIHAWNYLYAVEL